MVGLGKTDICHPSRVLADSIMAEGFTAADYVTSSRLKDLEGKRLWLVRVPRHVDTKRLEGLRVKLPSRKRGEGRVLGGATPGVDDDGQASEQGLGREKLILKAAHAAESSGFRALFSTDDDTSLAVAPPFAGQVNVSVELSAVKETGEDGEATPAMLMEPYRGRPQLTGMRVRSRLLGAGSVYSRTVKTAKKTKKASKRTKSEEPGSLPSSPTSSKKRRRSAIGTSAEEDGLGQVSTLTRKGSKKNRSSL